MLKPDFEVKLAERINCKWRQLQAREEYGALWPGVDDVLDRLDQIPISAGYRRLAECAADCLASADIVPGQTAALTTYLKGMIVRAMARFPEKYARSKIVMPAYAPALYFKEFERILDSLDEDGRDVWDFGKDIFCKDLAICCVHVIPVSCQVVCVSGIPRRTLFLKPMRALFRKLYYFYCKHKGFKPTFEIHMHPENRRYFSPLGRDRCYKLVADLLMLNPRFKGLQASSWFYDEQLKEISPHLGYLTKTPQKYGAECFYLCDEDQSSGAFNSSTQRLQLYKNAKYQPRTYLLSWPKQGLLRYAAQLDSNVNDPR